MAICKEVIVPMNGKVYEVISSRDIDSDFYKVIVTSLPVEKQKPVKKSKKLAKLFEKAKYNPRYFEELRSIENKPPVLMNRFFTF